MFKILFGELKLKKSAKTNTRATISFPKYGGINLVAVDVNTKQGRSTDNMVFVTGRSLQ